MPLLIATGYCNYLLCCRHYYDDYYTFYNVNETIRLVDGTTSKRKDVRIVENIYQENVLWPIVIDWMPKGLVSQTCRAFEGSLPVCVYVWAAINPLTLL